MSVFKLISKAKEPLEKGLNGDWQKEGYTIHHEIIPSEKTREPHWYPQGKLALYAKDKTGKVVATASVNHAHSKALMKPRGISVDEGHERKGLATAMYQHAEKVMGKKMIPQDGHQTPGGAALWKQPNRPFGRRNEKKIENYSDKEVEQYNKQLGIPHKKPEDLEKGQNGDWQKEGYEVKHIPKRGELSFGAFKDGKIVGRYSFAPGGDSLYVNESETHPEHQRKGLATAAYKLAEAHSGLKIAREPRLQSWDAKGLWDQSARPFGKSVFNLLKKADIHVKPGYHKIRQLRDLIAEKGGEVRKADIEKAGYNLKSLGIDKLVSPKGMLRSDDISKHLEGAPSMKFDRSDGEYGNVEDISDDWSDYPEEALDRAYSEEHDRHSENFDEDFNVHDHMNNEDFVDALDSSEREEFKKHVAQMLQHEGVDLSTPEGQAKLEHETTPGRRGGANGRIAHFLQSEEGQDAYSRIESETRDDQHQRRLDNLEVRSPRDYEHTSEYNIPSRSRGEYRNAYSEQRHSVDPSQVFQLNLHDDHINQLKEKGLWDAYRQMDQVSRMSGHPTGKNGMGWVRYTHGDDGVHVDEVQSDFGQSLHNMVKEMQDKVKRNPDYANNRITQDMTVGGFLEHVTPEKVKEVANTIFQGHHPSQILLDGFLQHLRDQGHHDKQLHIWDQNPKAEMAGQDLPTEKEGYKRRGFHELHPGNQQAITEGFLKHRLNNLSNNKKKMPLTESEKAEMERANQQLTDYNDHMTKLNGLKGNRRYNTPEQAARLEELEGLEPPGMNSKEYSDWHDEWQPEAYKTAVAHARQEYTPANFKNWAGNHSNLGPSDKFFEHDTSHPSYNQEQHLKYPFNPEIKDEETLESLFQNNLYAEGPPTIKPPHVMGLEHGSIPDTDADLPVHMQHTYGKMPKQMGFKPAKYGELETQHNPELKRVKAPTWSDKVRKSKKLQKSPALTYSSDFQGDAAKEVQPVGRKKDETVVHSGKAGDLYHHVFESSVPVLGGGKSVRHMISAHEDPNQAGLSHLDGYTADKNQKNQRFTFSRANTPPEHRGKGHAYLAYKSAIKYHGGVQSDRELTPESRKLWEKLAADPDLHVQLRDFDDSDFSKPHLANWKSTPLAKSSPLSLLQSLGSGKIFPKNNKSKPLPHIDMTEEIMDIPDDEVLKSSSHRWEK